MANALGLNVIPESVQEQNGFLHGICGFWQGNPVPFLLNPAEMDIMTPESLEPIYPAIEEAVVRWMRETGRMR